MARIARPVSVRDGAMVQLFDPISCTFADVARRKSAGSSEDFLSPELSLFSWLAGAAGSGSAGARLVGPPCVGWSPGRAQCPFRRVHRAGAPRISRSGSPSRNPSGRRLEWCTDPAPPGLPGSIPARASDGCDRPRRLWRRRCVSGTPRSWHSGSGRGCGCGRRLPATRVPAWILSAGIRPGGEGAHRAPLAHRRSRRPRRHPHSIFR